MYAKRDACRAVSRLQLYVSPSDALHTLQRQWLLGQTELVKLQLLQLGPEGGIHCALSMHAQNEA